MVVLGFAKVSLSDLYGSSQATAPRDHPIGKDRRTEGKDRQQKGPAPTEI